MYKKSKSCEVSYFASLVARVMNMVFKVGLDSGVFPGVFPD